MTYKLRIMNYGYLVLGVKHRLLSLYIYKVYFLPIIGVFFGILLLRAYNLNGYFSLAYYAMLVSIFIILGAIGL